MRRIITFLLQAGVVLTCIAAILFSVRIIVEQALGIGNWYWGGAVAVFIGPLAFVTALFVFERCIDAVVTEPNNA